jgi:hypothetical protein
VVTCSSASCGVSPISFLFRLISLKSLKYQFASSKTLNEHVDCESSTSLAEQSRFCFGYEVASFESNEKNDSNTKSPNRHKDRATKKSSSPHRRIQHIPPTTMKLSVCFFSGLWLTSALSSSLLVLLKPKLVVAQRSRLGGPQQKVRTMAAKDEAMPGVADLAETIEDADFWGRFLAEPSSMPIEVDRCAGVSCTNPMEGCDPFDGNCKPIDGIVPCVAIIDESSQSDSFIDARWAEFRDQFPFRPFCLLRPLDLSSRLYLPPVFVNDTRTIFANVSRDSRGLASVVQGPSDWFTICELGIYEKSDIDFIGRFLDVSGSMTLQTVLESEAIFQEKVRNANLTIKEVRNGVEDWITPFLTTLVPSGNFSSENALP